MTSLGFENGQIVPAEMGDEDLEVGLEELSTEEMRRSEVGAYALAGEILRRGFMLLLDRREAPLNAAVVASAFGLAVDGCSDTEIARRHGISKQAVQQAKKRVLRELGVGSVFTRGGKKHIENYAKTNYRRPKKVW